MKKLEGRMELCVIVHILSFLSFATTGTMSISMSKPRCQKCGNMTIPYPFGIGSNCSANSSFTIICRNSTTPFLSSINMEAISISLSGTVVVKQPISPMNCSTEKSIGHLPISVEGSPFTISAHYNTLVVLGCKNSIWLLDSKKDIVGECTPMCDANSTQTSCSGVNDCCETAFPPRLKELEYTYKTNEANNNDSFCGYAFPVDKKWLERGYKIYEGLLHDVLNPFDQESGFAPLVLEWDFGELEGYSDGDCKVPKSKCYSFPDDSDRRVVNITSSCEHTQSDEFCHLHPTHPECRSFSSRNQISKPYNHVDHYNYGKYDYESKTKYCSCADGYEGNPYLGDKGCVDIDECRNSSLNDCIKYGATCYNTLGSFRCHVSKDPVKIVFMSLLIVLSALALLLIAWNLTKAVRQNIKDDDRRRFFKRNGGLLLEKQLSATDNGLENTKLYGSNELIQATDHYNENRVLGRGGLGTVYKGMLKDGRIVAVKKSKRLEGGDLEVFINEVVILSQVNHRNVVKLLGCCLETEVPLLVYEFIPNGTLFQHLHDPNEEFPLTWVMRLRIAREVAGALAYLHSSASAPIFHRDIKSTNILLNDRYCAKISDFGTSRSIAIDKTHLTTQVQGTFGYFDPEYFQSSHFTDKSDVYSFGVVMVEILTGEKAISPIRVEEGRGLAAHFLDSLEENQLFDILDARVISEAKREVVMGVAHLARRCLHSSGKRRPTMKEVAAELEGLQGLEECSNSMHNEDGSSKEWHAVEVSEYSNSFSISGSMNMDSIAPYSPQAEYPLLYQT